MIGCKQQNDLGGKEAAKEKTRCSLEQGGNKSNEAHPVSLLIVSNSAQVLQTYRNRLEASG